ncbi:hypothetical protein HYPSUDRAFT_185826 [Hypholoma sublateritium FD-334 SS-4]|uniref:Hydrophobin n=1 Tax=Hypholoma sublateritium (strain FD-334 SS-4) TaxID=945553 RepID=A0A0D2NVC9_HYPSF|nr:hypothetical protein HYPSUDRAFT_185826 [Hypholoma sublateritium FD-334 SS-4]
MFARTSALFVFALPVLAAATAFPRNNPPDSPSNQCNTGSLQCCESTQDASTANTGLLGVLLSLLGINVGSITGQVGVTCSPITVVGVSGTSCTEQPVCCTDNTFNGVVALGCTPININL